MSAGSAILQLRITTDKYVEAGWPERLAYLKLWLGIMIVTGISLIGWLLTSIHSASGFLLLGGFVGLFSIAVGCLALHRQIELKIKEVSEL